LVVNISSSVCLNRLYCINKSTSWNMFTVKYFKWACWRSGSRIFCHLLYCFSEEHSDCFKNGHCV